MSRPTSADAFRAQNETARIILADLERYGGAGSLAVQWATAVLAKVPADADAGPLFRGEAA
jgi:hypothetical protein